MGLNLGCGDGALELHAFKLGMCQRFEAFDIAEGAIEVAREGAIQQGIHDYVKYEVADINKIKLRANKYDIAFCSMSAHHFSALEHVFSEVRRALKPSGWFILNEYVGPNQFQWTNQQIQIINEMLDILPSKYRALIPFPGKYKEKVWRPSIEEMNEIDPSEAIRSAEIVPLLQEYFHIVERVDYGGTILHILLQDIVGNFDTEKEEDLTILKLLCYLEETLIENKVIPSDFAFIVAQKKDQDFKGMPNWSSEQPRQNISLKQDGGETIGHLSGEDIARKIPIKKIIKAIGFKVANKPGFGWLYRYRDWGKKLLGG